MSLFLQIMIWRIKVGNKWPIRFCFIWSFQIFRAGNNFLMCPDCAALCSKYVIITIYLIDMWAFYGLDTCSFINDFCSMYSILLEFFVKLGQYCVATRKEDYKNDAGAEYKSTKLMAQACLYISQNCTQPLTLDDISHHMGISKSHFAHLFKKYTNMTFIDFLTTERIKRTETLILNPKAHIIDIAFESGFSSISSFNRAFKKIKGVSPSEFRERMINSAF